MPEGPLLAPERIGAIPGLVLLDCRPGPRAPTLAGALYADLETDLSAPGDPAVGGRHPLPALAAWRATLGRWGIGPDTPVAAFDDDGGGMYAARAWWMLAAVGHRRAWVVDGGTPAAVAAGVPVGAPASPPGGDPYPAARWARPTVDGDEVERLRHDAAWVVVDARSPERWRGEVEPLDPVPGRIPGAVNLPWTSLVGPDGRLVPPAALRQRFRAALGGRERWVAQCGSGVTACHLLLAAERAGIDGGALYVGSFSAWCRQGRPVARGP